MNDVENFSYILKCSALDCGSTHPPLIKSVHYHALRSQIFLRGNLECLECGSCGCTDLLRFNLLRFKKETFANLKAGLKRKCSRCLSREWILRALVNDDSFVELWIWCQHCALSGLDPDEYKGDAYSFEFNYAIPFTPNANKSSITKAFQSGGLQTEP